MSRRSKSNDGSGGGNIIYVGPRKVNRYEHLTALEKLKLGKGCAKGSDLKYIPNEDHVALHVFEGRKKVDTKIVPKKELEEDYTAVEGNVLKKKPALKKKPRKSLYCYLIKAEIGGAEEPVYKIGKSCNPESRMKDLQTIPNTKLELVAYSNLVKEKDMHCLLKKIKIPHPHLREWFRLSSEQLQMCTKIITGIFSEESLGKLVSTIKPYSNRERKKAKRKGKGWPSRRLFLEMIDYRDKARKTPSFKAVLKPKKKKRKDPFDFSEF